MVAGGSSASKELLRFGAWVKIQITTGQVQTPGTCGVGDCRTRLHNRSNRVDDLEQVLRRLAAATVG